MCVSIAGVTLWLFSFVVLGWLVLHAVGACVSFVKVAGARRCAPECGSLLPHTSLTSCCRACVRLLMQEMKSKRVSDIPFVPVSGPVLFEEVERARSREAAQRGRRVMGSTGGGASASGSRVGRK